MWYTALGKTVVCCSRPCIGLFPSIDVTTNRRSPSRMSIFDLPRSSLSAIFNIPHMERGVPGCRLGNFVQCAENSVSFLMPILQASIPEFSLASNSVNPLVRFARRFNFPQSRRQKPRSVPSRHVLRHCQSTTSKKQGHS